jgi:hypothetical protein
MALAIAKELYREWEKILKWKKIIFAQKEIFLRKVWFTLITNPEIAKDLKLVTSINSIQAGTITDKKLRLSTPEEINKTSLDVWLIKKSFDRLINWRTFSKSDELAKFKKEKWLEKLNDTELEEKIISGEIILETKPIRIEIDDIKISDTGKIIKKIEIIKNKFKIIRSIIISDIKENYHFTVENMSEISPLIDSIQNSLRSIKKESERLNDEFTTLRNELIKWSNSDEGIIKSSLFQIHQIINSL